MNFYKMMNLLVFFIYFESQIILLNLKLFVKNLLKSIRFYEKFHINPTKFCVKSKIKCFKI